MTTPKRAVVATIALSALEILSTSGDVRPQLAPASPTTTAPGTSPSSPAYVAPAPGSTPWLVAWSNQSLAVSTMPPVVQGAAGTSPWLVAWSGQSVTVSALPSIPAGSNVIGAVTQSGGPWSVSGAITAQQGGSWTVAVSNLPGTQPVSAVSLPLPANASTAALQSATQSAAGTQPSVATGVQGVTGGNPLSVTVTNPTAAAPSTVTANQGAAGATPWPMAPYVAGAIASTSNPSPVAVQNFPATQAVSASTLPLPAGASTAANQSSEVAALGTTADTAYAGSGSASIVAALKGVYTALIAPTPAGSAIIGRMGIDQTTAGTTNGVVVNSSALPTGAATAAGQAVTQNAPGTSGAKADAIQGVTGGVPVPVQGAQGWNEFLGQASTANQAYNGTVRVGGAVAGSSSPYGYFQAVAFSTVAGSLAIYNYNTVGGTISLIGTATVPAGGAVVLKVPAFGAQFLAGFQNGANGGSFTLYDGFTTF